MNLFIFVLALTGLFMICLDNMQNKYFPLYRSDNNKQTPIQVQTKCPDICSTLSLPHYLVLHYSICSIPHPCQCYDSYIRSPKGHCWQVFTILKVLSFKQKSGHLQSPSLKTVHHCLVHKLNHFMNNL